MAKNIRKKNVWSKKKCGCKKEILVQKIFRSKEVWSTKIRAPKKFGPKSLVKIESVVTAEILLLWTNVAMTYVAWTNVTVTFACVKDGSRNLPLKFCQNGVINR